MVSDPGAATAIVLAVTAAKPPPGVLTLSSWMKDNIAAYPPAEIVESAALPRSLDTFESNWTLYSTLMPPAPELEPEPELELEPESEGERGAADPDPDGDGVDPERKKH
jgi:hypothetical protein